MAVRERWGATRRESGTAPGWRNWAGTQGARPVRTARPRNTAEVAALVADAADRGLRVKAVGSGHSFTGVAVTDGLHLLMDALDRPIGVDRRRGLVTVEAGMPLHRLNRLLDAHGMALTNMGDIDRQTVSGAISTGTHGTGRSSGGLSAQVTAVELVTADGSVLSCSADREPEVFAAARLGLGALGVLCRVTLRCEPAFLLRAVEMPMPLDRVLEELDDMVRGNEHMEFYWFPHTDRTLTKRNNRPLGGARRAPVPRARAWFEDEFLSNTVYEGVNRLGCAVPAAIPRLNAVAARALSPRVYTDVSHRVFTSPRRVVFREMEYAVPRAVLPEVLRELRRLPERHGERVGFPVEVRFAPADDVWLSTAHGRESAYVAVHQYHRRPHAGWFRVAEEVLIAAGGRPHWGKLHRLGAEELGHLYPRLDDFRRVRSRLDPAGVFGNPHLERVLGPV
ncbi:D-arabinono-1,4-lactone oxidase [Streptomyces calidiresistens]|uniref:FAD-binding protein n=1 Tax=Streptomyces calidiresistens TaxID=1485586 RepID=A0A7W3XWQ8_9ACTN|nr:D-arabinono-1,4-lactone oxidase [Streptomyces calidiresistens]MBB0230016.1 FAD-binding protein [Streptomyces calidiresistens]